MKRLLLFFLLIPTLLFADDFISDYITYKSNKWGYGTTDPQEKLEIVGKVKATSFVGSGNELTGITAAAAWGSITGSLNTQTDLQGALDGKATLPISLTSGVSGTLPLANLSIIPLDGLQVSGSLPLTRIAIIPLETKVSGTLPATAIPRTFTADNIIASSINPTTLTVNSGQSIYKFLSGSTQVDLPNMLGGTGGGAAVQIKITGVTAIDTGYASLSSMVAGSSITPGVLCTTGVATVTFKNIGPNANAFNPALGTVTVMILDITP